MNLARARAVIPVAPDARRAPACIRWPIGPADGVALGEADVHVWAVVLDQTARIVASLHSLLDDIERSRAARFHRPIDRDRYVVSHGAMRLVLGRYLGCAAHTIRMTADPQGKPRLADEHHLRFNLAHSEGLALLALNVRGEIGVDVESIVALPDVFDVAAICFTPNERRALHAVADPDRARAFLAGWTRKEAYLKAMGSGLRAPLQRFEVSLSPGAPSRLCRVDGSEQKASGWTLESLDPADGYIGAVAIEQRAVTLTAWTLDVSSSTAAIG